MALSKRSNGKLALTNDVNPIIDVVNGLGRHDIASAGRGEVFGSETWLAVVNEAVDGSQGFFRGSLMVSEASPQNGAIAASDLGTPDPNNNCIIAMIGGGSVAVDGSVVVFGRIFGFNDPANGGVGESKDQGLPVLVVTSSYVVAVYFDSQISGKQGAYIGTIIVDPPDQNADLTASLTPGSFGTIGDSNCYIRNMAELRGGAPVPTAQVSWGRIAGAADADDDHPGWVIVEVDAFISPWQKISFSMGDIGGSNGDTTTACSLTYTWTDPSGTTHSADTPEATQRPTVGYVKAADKGQIYWDNTLDPPAWTLWWINEVPDREACS